MLLYSLLILFINDKCICVVNVKDSLCSLSICNDHFMNNFSAASHQIIQSLWHLTYFRFFISEGCRILMILLLTFQFSVAFCLNCGDSRFPMIHLVFLKIKIKYKHNPKKLPGDWFMFHFNIRTRKLWCYGKSRETPSKIFSLKAGCVCVLVLVLKRIMEHSADGKN